MTSENREALQARWLADIQLILEEHLRGHTVDVYLFGSRARGDQRVWSDVDIAVDPQGPMPEETLVNLRGALEESSVPLFVDVVDLRRVTPAFRNRVLSEGKRWTASRSA